MTNDFNPTDGVNIFPGNVIALIVARLQMLYPNTSIVKRKLRPGEQTQTIGVYPMQWGPDEDSYEIGSGNLVLGQTPSTANQPTIGIYLIGIQTLVLDSDEESGILTHNVMSNAIRSLLYNDAPLGVGLNSLAVVTGHVTEVIQARRINRQRFLDGQISGNYVYLSTTEYAVDTESK
jgi:hypothetical protein